MSDKLAVLQAQVIEADLRKIEAVGKDVVKMFKDMVAATDKVNRAFNSGKIKEYTNAIRDLNTITQQYVSVERRLADAMMRTARLERELARVASEQNRTRREAAEALRAESRARQQAIREAAAQARGDREANSAHAQLTRQTRLARQTARDYGSEMILLKEKLRQGTITQRDYNSQISKLARDFKLSTAEAIRLERELRRVNQQTLPSNQRSGALQGRVNDILKGVLGAGAIENVANKLIGIASDGYDTIKMLDAQNLSLKSIFKTEAQIAFQKEYLSEVTNKYGLELVSTTDAYAKYSAAVRNTYLEGEQARKIFSNFSGAAAKLGLSADQTAGIFKALEQMISKGKIQAEELRGQLGDRMAGAFRLFADGMGVSTAELDKMLKAGGVIADDVLPKVADRIAEVYDLNTAGNIDTIAAAQNRLKNEWTSFLSEFTDNKDNMDFLAGSIEALSHGMKFLLDTLIKDGSAGKEIVTALVDVLYSLLKAIGTAGGISDTTSTKMEKFQATLQLVSADVNILASAIKYLTSIVSNFFSTMFEKDGWDKFNQKMEKSAESLINSYKQWDKLTNDADRLFAGLTEKERKQRERENEIEKVRKLWSDALKSKKAYFQYKGFYYETKGGKPTGKSLDDYIDNGDKLEKKTKVKRTVLTDDAKKPKAAKLSVEEKDFVNKATGTRDSELAALENKRLDLLVNEEDYWKEYLAIYKRYDSKIRDFIKGANAKQIQVEGAVLKKAAEARKESTKKIYDISSKNLEENNKKESNILERASKKIEQDKTLTDVEKLNKQMEIDSQMIALQEDYYSKQITLAGNSAESVIAWERKRDEEIGKIEDKRLERLNSMPEAVIKELEIQAAITQSKVDANFEDKRSLILKDKSINEEQRAFKISQLDRNLQIEKNREEIKRLQLLKAQILARTVIRSMNGQSVVLTPEEEKALKEYEATIKALENSNISLGAENLSDFAPEWKKTKEVLVKGFQDMGMDNFATTIGDQFDELFQKIITGSLSAKDAVVLAASAMADGLSSMVNNQKEKTIAALDEQLKYSQQTSEQEINFISGRLESLNALGELNEEQILERNRLEDEQRTLQDQQRQREKLIETQKARAEQKAAAQQALINGALGASLAIASYPFPASLIPAGLALGFGIAQSISIMSKDPVPKYWKGRNGGKAEFAVTQDRGREIIAGEDGRIKSLGSDSGDKMTWLDKGDTVYTADETKRILKTMGPSARVGSKVYKNGLRESMRAPQISIINQTKDNSDEIARKFGDYMDRKLSKYSHPTTERVFGKIYRHRGANTPELIGEYDLKTLEEKYY